MSYCSAWQPSLELPHFVGGLPQTTPLRERRPANYPTWWEVPHKLHHFVGAAPQTTPCPGMHHMKYPVSLEASHEVPPRREMCPTNYPILWETS